MSSPPPLEQLLYSGVENIRRIVPKADVVDCLEYIDYGEYGVAYDLLIFLLSENGIPVPEDVISAGKIIGGESNI